MTTRAWRPLAVVALTFAYVIVASVGAIVATGRGLPAEWMGLLSSQNEIWQEALIGGGTALSPTVWLLIPMAGAAVVSLRAGRAGEIASLLLAAIAALTVVGALGEPITWRSIAPDTFDALNASISVLMVVVPALLAVAAFGEFRTRRVRAAAHEVVTA